MLLKLHIEGVVWYQREHFISVLCIRRRNYISSKLTIDDDVGLFLGLIFHVVARQLQCFSLSMLNNQR